MTSGSPELNLTTLGSEKFDINIGCQVITTPPITVSSRSQIIMLRFSNIICGGVI